MKKVGGRDHWYGTCFFVPPRGKMLLTQGLAGSMVSSILHELNQDNSVKQFVHQNVYSPFNLSRHLGEIHKGSTGTEIFVSRFCAFLGSCPPHNYDTEPEFLEPHK